MMTRARWRHVSWHGVFVCCLLGLPALPARAQPEIGDPAWQDKIIPLVEQLQDQNPDNRIKAIAALGETHDNRAGDFIITALDDPVARVRKAAAEELGSFFTKTVTQALITTLKDADNSVRAAAARSIWAHKDEQAADALLVLVQDTDAKVRAAGVCAASRTHLPRVLGPIRAALNDKSPLVRADAARALGDLIQLQNWVTGLPGAWRIILTNPQGVDVNTKANVERIFQEIGWYAIKDALAKLLEEKDQNVRSSAACALKKLQDPRADAYIIDALQCPDPLARRDLLWTISNTRDVKVVDACLVLLKQEKDPETLRALVHVLGAAQDRRAVEPLIAALPTAPLKARYEFLWALGWIKDMRAYDVIVPYLREQDAGLRSQAAFALCMLHDPRAIDLLAPMIGDPEQSVRHSIIMAFNNINDPRNVKLLLTMLANERDNRLRLEIISALANKDDAGIVEPLLALKDVPELFAGIVSAVGRYKDPRITDIIIAAARDPDKRTRQYATQSLRYQDTQLVCQLAPALLKDTDVYVRQNITGILQRINDTAVVEPLLLALNDADIGVRRTAIDGLARRRDARALPALRELVKNDPDKGVRELAAQAITQIGDGNVGK